MDGIELMAQAMHASRARLDVAAENLANVSSAGFRRKIARTTLGARGFSTASVTDAAQGPLEATGRAFDLAATGRGALLVRDLRHGVLALRSGSFVFDRDGRLVDERGRVLLGAHGSLRATPEGTVDPQGVVRDARGYVLDRLRLLSEPDVRSGFLERSNVDAVHEMVDILAAQRAFETAQSSLSAIDDVRGKAANDVGRVKA